MYLHIVNYGQFMNSQLAGAETISNDRCIIKGFFFLVQAFDENEASFLPFNRFVFI